WPGPLGVFNAATGDAITVREIADMVVDCLGLAPGGVDYVFTGGARGWSGDVPVVRLNCDRLKRLGWSCQNTSGEAMRRSIEAMLEQ
ncbi:MAG: NAD-dependent dehydratase, partial [Alphaproteobacteria bacterium]|nr:NAD-dependent dehydratase [Alphaproteobacteria bacterium]